MYDTEGTDTKREWIELYNAGPDTVDISKWKFVDKANHALNAPPKNGGTGSLSIAPGAYAILASDAATFSSEHAGVQTIIDTTMSLNNSDASLSLLNGTSAADAATYSKAQGAAGDGDSLQLHNGAWIHAKPTPGAVNATNPSVKAAPAPVAKKQAPAKPKQAVAVTRANADEMVSNDPLAVVNASPTSESLSQTAAAGSLGSSVWWLAAVALAIGTGATAALISSTKKREWQIEESE